jgi:hypothetical protein
MISAAGCLSQTKSAPIAAITNAMTIVQRDCVGCISDLTCAPAFMRTMFADCSLR